MEQCVLALGFFDGVHLGHGGLLKKTRQVANRLGLPAAALPLSALSGEKVLRRPRSRVWFLLLLNFCFCTLR